MENWEKIRKIEKLHEENKKKNNRIFGKFTPILTGKLGKLSQIRKVQLEDKESLESSFCILGKLGKFIPKIRKILPENEENSSGKLGKFLLNIRKVLLHIRKIHTQN